MGSTFFLPPPIRFAPHFHPSFLFPPGMQAVRKEEDFGRGATWWQWDRGEKPCQEFDEVCSGSGSGVGVGFSNPWLLPRRREEEASEASPRSRSHHPPGLRLKARPPPLAPGTFIEFELNPPHLPPRGGEEMGSAFFLPPAIRFAPHFRPCFLSPPRDAGG